MAKLVRDKIPEIVRKRGMKIKTHRANEQEYWRGLKLKMQEELEELSQSKNPDELVDLLEVIHAIASFKKIDFNDLEKLRKAKERTSGSFKGRIISDYFAANESAEYHLANDKDLKLAIKSRNIYSSKRENGRITFVGGSENFHGAPALASNAAYSILASLRVGTGYVTAFVPRGVLASNRAVSPNIIVRPLSGNNLNPNDFSMLSKVVDNSECLVIGNGLGRASGSLKSASKIIHYAMQKAKNVIVDADAIYAVEQHSEKLGKNVLITPNEKEFTLFFKENLDPKNLKKRIDAAVKVSKQLNCIVLLKGHDTIITDGERTKVVSSKTAALATMGTGDVLSGIIAGFAANNYDMFTAAVAGAYLHSNIGDKLHNEKGNHILASDVVDYIPKILKGFDRDY